MFGQERGDALDSILLNIEKTVSGEPAIRQSSRGPPTCSTS